MEHADDNDMYAIEEPLFPRTPVTYWSMFLTLEIGALILSSMLVLPLFWGSFAGLLIGYTFAALGLAPFCLIFAGTQLAYFRKNGGRIVFDGECISVFLRGKQNARAEYVAKLTECQWFYGNRSWVMFDGGDVGPLGLESFLMIELPPPNEVNLPGSYGFWRYTSRRNDYWRYATVPVIIAVGQNAKTRQEWEDVFYQLGVERNRQREESPVPFSDMFCAYFAFFLFITSFFCFNLLSKWTHSFLLLLEVPSDITPGITWPLFFFGGMMGTMVSLAALEYRESRKMILKKERDDVEWFDHQKPSFWMPTVTVLVIFVVFVGPSFLLGSKAELPGTWRTWVAVLATSFSLSLLAGFVLTHIARRKSQVAQSDDLDGIVREK